MAKNRWIFSNCLLNIEKDWLRPLTSKSVKNFKFSVNLKIIYYQVTPHLINKMKNIYLIFVLVLVAKPQGSLTFEPDIEGCDVAF